MKGHVAASRTSIRDMFATSARASNALAKPLASTTLMAFVVSSALTTLLWSGTSADFVGSSGFNAVGDHHVYAYMASHDPGYFHVAPWCWRILVPAVVRLLPMTIEHGFLVITLVTTIFTGFAVYLVCRKLGFDFSLSILGMIVFYSLSYATRFNIRDFWLTDTTAFMFSAFAVLAILYERRMLFVICITLGVLSKESVIFIAPLYYTFTAHRRWDRVAFGWTMLLIAPSAIELAILRGTIPAWNGHLHYLMTLPGNVRSDIGNVSSYNLIAVARLELAARWRVWPQEIVNIVTSFGTLGLALPLLGGMRRLRVMLIKFWPFLVLVYSQLLFTFNTQRLLVLAFIPIIFAVLLGVDRAVSEYKVPAVYFWIAICTAVAIELSSRTESAPSPVLQLGIFGALAITVLIHRAFSRANDTFSLPS